MVAIQRMVTVASHTLIVLAFVSGFMLGAIFGETFLNQFQEPTALTYWLAQ